MTLQNLIDLVRANVHDNDSLEYQDATLINYINDGIRFVRRMVMDIDPMLLVEEPLTGSTEPDEYAITLEDRVSAVVDVRIDGKALTAVNPRNIPDTSKEGTPYCYYVTGFKTINLWPRPTNSVSYEIAAIPDIVLLEEPEDVFPMMNELEDFVVEYAGIRASLTNEFDMSQETSLMGSVVAQIESLIRRYNCRGVQTTGYWDGHGTRVRDYGRRYW